MASPVQDSILAAAQSTGDAIEHSLPISLDPPRLKGTAKFIHRISSSPSLAQIGRRRARSNPYTNRNTISCVSLASGSTPPNHDNSYSSQSLAGGYSTVPTTPGLDTPYRDGSSPIRRVELSSPGPSTPPSPLPLGIPLSRALSPFPELMEGYFTTPLEQTKQSPRINFDFWGEMPHEIKLSIFSYLRPKELVRASIVCRDFHEICFDGQLWTCFDASEFYRDIPAESLSKIIIAAGPFVKDLNLRGCVQVEHYKRAEVVVKACKNLINATLEGCKNFQRSTLHSLLKSNERLSRLNLTGLTAVTNGTCKIIAQSCPQLEMFNVSWCTHMDSRGIKAVLLGCTRLRDLRAGEVRGFNNLDVAQTIFETNNLERLVLSGCSEITDEAFKTMIIGRDPEIDILTEIPLVPVRKFRHLDLSRCNRLTKNGVKYLAHLVPHLQGLQLSGCTLLEDAALSPVLATTPYLTHLDVEELSLLTNTFLLEDLAKSPCAPNLQHLSISYCENLGDVGMLPVVRACTALQSIDMDNTRIGDLVLVEAASMVRSRSTLTIKSRPKLGLRMVVFDCQNVTWTGVREVLSRNAEVSKLNSPPCYSTEIIQLKCFYGWMPTVKEHTNRVMRGDLAAAGRLERKWAEYMMANEEAGAAGAGVRRRRRRAREAQMLHADEEEGGFGMGGIGRRRRARSGCAVM